MLKLLSFLAILVVALADDDMFDAHSRIDWFKFTFKFTFNKKPIPARYKIVLSTLLRDYDLTEETGVIATKNFTTSTAFSDGLWFSSEYGLVVRIWFIDPVAIERRNVDLSFPPNTFPVGEDTSVKFKYDLAKHGDHILGYNEFRAKHGVYFDY